MAAQASPPSVSLDPARKVASRPVSSSPDKLPPAGALPGKPQAEEPGFTLKADVRLVNVFVTVTTPQGAPISNLRKEDFQLAEDGIPQKIALFSRESELPLSIVLAVDTSLSTRKDIKLEAESARRFLHSILRPSDALSLYQFSETVEELVPFTSRLKRIDRGIDRLRVGSATALYDALFLASESLSSRQGRKVLLVITDGGDTVSKSDYASAVRAAQEAEAIVYSIIVVPIAADAGRNIGGEHALIQLSLDTGGKHFYSESPGQLDTAFQQVSEELRTQYLLGYYPSKRLSDSEFRRIQITVSSLPGENQIPAQLAKVRARSGYFTSKSK